MKDPYDILGVRRNASSTEIELAYKGRRTQYHPDKYSGSDAETIRWATDRMQEVNEAHALLSDVQRRARFDANQAANIDATDGRAPAYAGASESNASREGGAMSLRAFLYQRFAPYGGFSRTYFAPDIPLKKLSNALQSYGQGIQPEEVVALMDSTLFGGAKEGVMLTEKQIRLKDLGSGLAVRAWPNIQRIDAQKTEIYINGHLLITCLAVNEGEVVRLVEGLKEYLQARGNVRQGPQGERPAGEAGEAASSLAQKYATMYDMAKREFLALCERIQRFELQVGEDFVDRDNAAAYFGYLEQCLRDGGNAEQAWAILGEIAVLSKAIAAYCDTGKPVPPILAQSRDEDSQLTAELRALLRYLEEVVQAAEQQARTQQFFGR